MASICAVSFVLSMPKHPLILGKGKIGATLRQRGPEVRLSWYQKGLPVLGSASSCGLPSSGPPLPPPCLPLSLDGSHCPAGRPCHLPSWAHDSAQAFPAQEEEAVAMSTYRGERRSPVSWERGLPGAPSACSALPSWVHT
jgi:hypothetical protein